MTEPHPEHQHMVRALEDMTRNGHPFDDHQFEIDARVYWDPERFERELEMFRHYPIAVAHASKLATPGSTLVHDRLGVPILVTRNKDGAIGAFLNVCRHRGTRLLEQEGYCHKKGFVCPYHSWAYDLSGSLINVPEREFFPKLNDKTLSLVPVPVEERFGLVWVVAQPRGTFDFDAFFGPLDDDLSAYDIDKHVVYREKRVRRRTNWKLVMDAFLDGYHIRHLHRNTVYPFFKNCRSYAERKGKHVRALVGRTEFRELVQRDPSEWNIREMASPSYSMFPNTVLVFHPDFISRMTMFPASPSEIEWEHTMLIPEAPKTPEAEAHWAKSFELIDGGVFQAEDLWVSEQIQMGLQSGANETLLFGGLEVAVEWFHEEINAAVEAVAT